VLLDYCILILNNDVGNYEDIGCHAMYTTIALINDDEELIKDFIKLLNQMFCAFFRHLMSPRDLGNR